MPRVEQPPPDDACWLGTEYALAAEETSSGWMCVGHEIQCGEVCPTTNPWASWLAAQPTVCVLCALKRVVLYFISLPSSSTSPTFPSLALDLLPRSFCHQPEQSSQFHSVFCVIILHNISRNRRSKFAEQARWTWPEISRLVLLKQTRTPGSSGRSSARTAAALSPWQRHPSAITPRSVACCCLMMMGGVGISQNTL